jgi:methyltransferase (TIGR00027 family)
MVRAMESYTPENQRLFNDPLVIHFLPWLAQLAIRTAPIRSRFIVWFDHKAPGIRGALLCRTRAIDDAVRMAVDRGLRTIVILGAGLDTRAYRLAELASLSVFEMDLPEVQMRKRARLTARSASQPANVHFVPIDFNTEPVEVVLARAGLGQDEPAMFIWEGVTQYLRPAAVDAVLRAIAQRPPGTELVFTYVREDAIGSGVYRQPEPWYFGIDPARLEAFLKECGLELLEDSGAGEHTARYLRPVGRVLEVSPVERVARAAAI